ncbi:MAG TPA: GAF and ANTAR domain-containing protein [Terriglobales bacterium]|nr:GAF and ANTAR domain-containing protein [Terriglobales bacterium]
MVRHQATAGADLKKFDASFLHHIARGIASAVPLPDLLTHVVEFAVSAAQCDSCFIYVLEGDELILRASHNAHPDLIDHLKLKLGQGITGWVAEHRQPVAIASNAYGDQRFRAFNELPEDRFEAFLSVPILNRDRVVGAINLQNRAPYSYTDYEIKMVSSIGLLVGAHVEMARLESENSQLSYQLETRKLVERAKGILQQDLKISEQDAYVRLQRQSQESRIPLRDVANAVILSQSLRAKPRP